MNLLVLGSSGQVGAYLCEYLRARGHFVEEFDIVNDETQDLRIQNNVLLDEKVRDADFVFFLAFDVGGSRYLSKYQHTIDFMNNNSLLMTNTFTTLDKYKKPFVFASSQMSNMSYSPYGVLKAVGENYSRMLRGRVVKFWNVYGVEHDFEKSHVITDFILKAKNTGIIDMMTDGQEEREFLYADDCCEALVAVMENYDNFSVDSELSVTSFRSTKIINVANIVASHFPNAKVVASDKKDAVQMDKRNEPDKTILEYWKPKTSLEEGVAKVVEAMNNE
jgi:nucleoside-diphosphate-sugar epimerase